MNELQKIELNLLKCFIEICKKLDLKYFLVAGSALGAVRHAGFIPWDDDVDVALYRDDYNKFMELAPALLPEGIFLQNYKTDPQFPLIFAKLRDSETTAIEGYYRRIEMNQGIYIDIFPLDGYPTNKREQKRLEILIRRYKKLSQCGLNYQESLPIKSKVAICARKLLGYHKRTALVLKKYESLISSYPVEKNGIICNHGNVYGKSDYMSEDCYGNGKIIEFEGIEICVPEKWDEYLSALYGDWRTPPPLEQRIGKHLFEICDTEKSYREYLDFSQK